MLNPESSGQPVSPEIEQLIQRLKKTSFFDFAEPDACPICRDDNFKILAEKDRYGFDINYVSCSACGFIFANPYYTDDCLEEFYTSFYSKIYDRAGSEKQVFEGQYINAVNSILPFVRRSGRAIGSVLDFGCGCGGALAAFPGDIDRVGYDFDESQMSYGRDLGLDLRHMRDSESDEDHYDLILLNQVLEHVTDPARLLSTLKARLAPGGILYVEVPGMATMLSGQFNPLLAFKNAHRHFFCLDALSSLSEAVGLKVLDGNESVQILLGSPTVLNGRCAGGEEIAARPTQFWTSQLMNPERANSSPHSTLTIFRRIVVRARIVAAKIIIRVKIKFNMV